MLVMVKERIANLFRLILEAMIGGKGNRNIIISVIALHTAMTKRGATP